VGGPDGAFAGGKAACEGCATTGGEQTPARALPWLLLGLVIPALRRRREV
jgi:MYXO-CTERM domain-containing protein